MGETMIWRACKEHPLQDLKPLSLWYKGWFETSRFAKTLEFLEKHALQYDHNLGYRGYSWIIEEPIYYFWNLRWIGEFRILKIPLL